MGCCYSFFCKDDCSSQNGEPNERTHLLVDPVSNSSIVQPVNSDDYYIRNSHNLPKKTDEQTALNRILQETATNVIDVAALDSHNLQQSECLERMKQYSLRLNQVCASNKLPYRNRRCILQDIAAYDKVLGGEVILLEDLELMTQTLSKVCVAISEIKIEHKEDLVVPFQIA